MDVESGSPMEKSKRCWPGWDLSGRRADAGGGEGEGPRRGAGQSKHYSTLQPERQREKRVRAREEMKSVVKIRLPAPRSNIFDWEYTFRGW
jgi:hypothetical protein